MGKLFYIFIAQVSFLYTALGLDIFAQKSDTFIFHGEPNAEYSEADYLALAYAKSQEALTYLSFKMDCSDIGIEPFYTQIISSKLNLFIKKIPEKVQTNTENAGKNLEEVLEDFDSQEAYDDYLDSLNSKILKLEFFALVDENSFDLNTSNYKVSWNAKNEAPAPKHNGKNLDLPEDGVFKLGEIDIDLENSEIYDGYHLEFSSDELSEYISFALAIHSARNIRTSFHTYLSNLEYITIIVRQAQGPSGILLYSANSLDKNEEFSETLDEENLDELTKEENFKTIKMPKPFTTISKKRHKVEFFEKYFLLENEEKSENLIEDFRPSLNIEFVEISKD